jgi:hypothetical protein
MAVAVGAVLLGGLAGCGGTQSNGDVVKAYMRDLAEVTSAYRLIKNDSQTKVPMTTRPEDLKARIERDIEAVKRLRDLPEDQLLELQLRYGPAVERLDMAQASEIMRLVQQVFKKKVPGTFIIGLEGVDKLFTSSDVTFLMDGYATMSKRVSQDLQEAITAYVAIKTAEQAEAAVPALRRLRYRIANDAVKLKHLEPARKDVKDKLQAQLKGSLTGTVEALHKEEERVRALGGAGPDAAAVMEPLPDQITALTS